MFLSWSHDFNAFQACVKLRDRVRVLVFSLLLNHPQMIKWQNVKGVELMLNGKIMSFLY